MPVKHKHVSVMFYVGFFLSLNNTNHNLSTDFIFFSQTSCGRAFTVKTGGLMHDSWDFTLLLASKMSTNPFSVETTQRKP